MIKLRILSKLLNRKTKINRKESEAKQNSTPIFEQEFQRFPITDELRTEIVNNPYKYQNLDVRIRTGKFYTDEEWEERSNAVLNKRLP